MANIRKEGVSTRGEWQQDSCSVGDSEKFETHFFFCYLAGVDIQKFCTNTVLYEHPLFKAVDKWLLILWNLSLPKDSSSILLVSGKRLVDATSYNIIVVNEFFVAA